ncbi:MAG: M6 family metalloprotease domain-containing protein [Bacteroidales bacterium]
MKKRLLILLAFFLILVSVKAAYFEKLPCTIKQPDGEVINCFVSGDEFYNWIHDQEAYTIIQAPDGYYYYAERNGDLLQASKYKVNTVNPASVGLSKWAKISESAYLERRSSMFAFETDNNTVRAPHTGTLNNIVIYIRFSDDDEFTTIRQIYDNNLNPTTGNTLKSYFKEVSYGNLTISSTHYPDCALSANLSYQDSHPRAYFQPFNATTNPIGYLTNERTAREHQLLADAIDWININSPVSATLNIDGDGDNKTDNVCFIIKGNSGGWSNLLWAHRWSLYSQNVYVNGKRVYDYTFQPENQVSVRTLCHEMFHALGSPDLYHYTNQGVISPVGNWDLMESGGGHMLAYLKWKYSNHTWVNTIPEITTSGTYTLNPLTSSVNNCFKIASPYSGNEYFMLEYRNKSGTFESNLPGSGLIVYRIDTSVNGNANGPPDEVYLYRPGGTVTVNGNTNSAHFSSNDGRTAINDTTNPVCFLQNGGIGGLNISNITNADTTISFNVSFPLPCTPPTVQANTFISSAITNNSMKIGFNRGNGNAVLIFARATNPVNAIPVNGTSYISDTAFGIGTQIGSGNYVVYNGTGNSVNLSSLASGTAYYFAVFEYNAISKCYKTPALTGDATTICIPLSLISQPLSSQSTCTPSGSISFSIDSAIGSTPIAYKWQFYNSGSWANVTNGTPAGASYINGKKANMTVSEITNAATYLYRCNLSNCNSANTLNSNIASLIVNLTPPVPVITQSGNTLVSDAPTGNQWYSTNTGYLPGATGNTYTPTQSGGYFVVVVNNGCESVDKSNIIYYNLNSISESNSDAFKINVAPNPFSGKTCISYFLSESSFVKIIISDVTGKELLQVVNLKQEKGDQKVNFSATNFTAGLYFYKLIINNSIHTGKLLINN